MRKYAFASTLALVGVPALVFSVLMLLRSCEPVPFVIPKEQVDRVKSGPSVDEFIERMSRQRGVEPDNQVDPE